MTITATCILSRFHITSIRTSASLNKFMYYVHKLLHNSCSFLALKLHMLYLHLTVRWCGPRLDLEDVLINLSVSQVLVINHQDCVIQKNQGQFCPFIMTFVGYGRLSFAAICLVAFRNFTTL